jgi:hypothetical protein
MGKKRLQFIEPFGFKGYMSGALTWAPLTSGFERDILYKL